MSWREMFPIYEVRKLLEPAPKMSCAVFLHAMPESLYRFVRFMYSLERCSESLVMVVVRVLTGSVQVWPVVAHMKNVPTKMKAVKAVSKLYCIS